MGTVDWRNANAYGRRFHRLGMSDITHFMLHPGGTKVIEACEAALGLTTGKLELCRQALRDYGNMSSVSVLFVLAEHLKQFPLGSGNWGIISALGPGFCAESLLVRF
jgi:alkylresorcinol/alkylpyrone synthase